jgi:hypothetical protein
MSKKIITVLAILMGALATAYFIFPFIQNFALKKSFEIHNEAKIGDNNDAFLRCNRDLFDPIFAYPFTLENESHIGFYRPGKLFWASTNDWGASYTGGTTVKNTTFEKLVKMAKEDCSQFQKGYLDYTGYEHLSEQEKDDRYWEIDAKNLGWTYTPYAPDPEPTEEEKARKRALEEMTEEERAEWEEMMLQRTLELGEKTKRLSDDEVKQLLMDE